MCIQAFASFVFGCLFRYDRIPIHFLRISTTRPHGYAAELSRNNITMSTIRFRLTELRPDAATLRDMGNLLGLTLQDVLQRASSNVPLFEITAFEGDWENDRETLVSLSNMLNKEGIPLVASEAYLESENAITAPELKNMIQQFREIELQTMKSTILEIGEIKAPSEFVPDDDDWTQPLS